MPMISVDAASTALSHLIDRAPAGEDVAPVNNGDEADDGQDPMLRDPGGLRA